MKILLVAPFFPPHRAIASLRTYSFAKNWALAGHEVTVLTTVKRREQSDLLLPTAGFQVFEIPYRVPRFLERIRNGEHATRTAPSAIVTPPSAKKRLASWVYRPLRWLKARTGIFAGVREPDLADFWVRPAIKWAMQQNKWDAIVSSFGPPAAIHVGKALKGRGRARTWAIDFRDLWTDNHLYGGIFPVTLLERHWQRQALSQADRLVTVSEGLAKRLRERSGKPVEVILNGYDAEGFADMNPEPAFPADGKIRLVYTGMVYPAGQEVTSLCQALALEPQATLVVASDQGSFWQELARRFGFVDRLEFRGSVPRSEALRLQRDASALVLLDWRDPRQGVLTGKVFEYMLSAAPIWVMGGATDSPVAQLVSQAGRGENFARDVERIRQAIRALASKELAKVQPDRNFIAGLSREAQALRFLKLLEEVR